MLDASLKKPLITAPGQLVLSAFSRQAAGIQENKPYVVRRVTQDETDYYYGLMQGTSMAAPQVAGILACWLQAYPQLTPEEAEEIIRSTAINDDFTGNVRENWDPFWGYGKIDAYAGLKECLARAASVGLSEVVGSDEPVSFRIGGREARVLFNNAEAGAVVGVCMHWAERCARNAACRLFPALTRKLFRWPDMHRVAICSPLRRTRRGSCGKSCCPDWEKGTRVMQKRCKGNRNNPCIFFV